MGLGVYGRTCGLQVGNYRWAITGCTWGLQVGLGIFRWNLAVTAGLGVSGRLKVYGRLVHDGAGRLRRDLAFKAGLGV